MLNDYKQWMIFLFLGGITINVAAQGLADQPGQMQGVGQQVSYVTEGEMAPPPPGPYQVDPDSKSTNINYDMHETAPYTQRSQPYDDYVAPQYPSGQMPDNPYGQGYYLPPAPSGYYRQYGGAYGNGYPPPYPSYPQYSQPQYMTPYGPRY